MTWEAGEGPDEDDWHVQHLRKDGTTDFEIEWRRFSWGRRGGGEGYLRVLCDGLEPECVRFGSRPEPIGIEDAKALRDALTSGVPMDWAVPALIEKPESAGEET